MKKAPLSGLLYREYYIGKRYVRNTIFISLSMAIVMLLVLISFEHGNLRLLTGELRDTFFNMALTYGKYLPIFGFCYISGSVLEISVKQENPRWHLFRLVTPAGAFRFAAAKYIYMVILAGLSLILCAAYLVIFGSFFPSNITMGTWGITFCCLALLSLFEIMLMVYSLLFGSIDKGGIATAGTFIVLMFIVYRFMPDIFQENPADPMAGIESFGAKALPVAVISLAVIYAAGFFVTGLLYQRREK